MSSVERHDDLRQVDGHEGWRGVYHLLAVDPDSHGANDGFEDVSEVFD